jgi:hypothetical protein
LFTTTQQIPRASFAHHLHPQHRTTLLWAPLSTSTTTTTSAPAAADYLSVGAADQHNYNDTSSTSIGHYLHFNLHNALHSTPQRHSSRHNLGDGANVFSEFRRNLLRRDQGYGANRVTAQTGLRRKLGDGAHWATAQTRRRRKWCSVNFEGICYGANRVTAQTGLRRQQGYGANRVTVQIG